MALSNDHIAASLKSRLGVSKSDSSRYLESALDLIKHSLAGGDDVLISGFGKFSVRQKAARRGRTLQRREDMNLALRKVVTFKCSPMLRENINDKEH